MIYLDSAATTFQKPPSVAAAMAEAMATMSSPGRGGPRAAMLAADTAFACREALAELFHLSNPEQVVFTMNATHALNLAIKSLVPPGGRAVISGYEHNAVTRPLAALGAQVRVARAPLFDPPAVLEAFTRQIAPDTHAVICSHVSNVFGFVQPIEEIAALCRRHGIPLIVDASQSAGVLPLDMTALGAAFLAMPLWPAGDRRIGVRRGGSRADFAGGRHWEHVHPAAYAGLPAGPSGGRDPQHARYCRFAGRGALCTGTWGGSHLPS